ncbi:MAG: ATP-dependent Clp protease proteolytic subunit [Pseudomonadota bacterium]
MRFLFGLVAFVALCVAGIQLMSRNAPTPAPLGDLLSIEADPLEPERVTFAWRGAIDAPMADAIEAAFADWRDKATVIVLDLHSPGGAVQEGDRVIKAIARMRKSHRVHTYVGPGADCLSMCVPVYLQGELRIAHETSRWMFHEPGAYDPLTGHRVDIYDSERTQSEMDVYNRYFKPSKMNPAWRENMRDQWRFGDIWKTGRQLKDERSNIIVVLERSEAAPR